MSLIESIADLIVAYLCQERGSRTTVSKAEQAWIESKLEEIALDKLMFFETRAYRPDAPICDTAMSLAAYWMTFSSLLFPPASLHASTKMEVLIFRSTVLSLLKYRTKIVCIRDLNGHSSVRCQETVSSEQSADMAEAAAALGSFGALPHGSAACAEPSPKDHFIAAMSNCTKHEQALPNPHEIVP